jgi:hypothetical protein
MIMVKVTNKCGPVENAVVLLEASNSGLLAEEEAGLSTGKNKIEVKTNAKGIASCAWQLGTDGASRSQNLKASLSDVPKGHTIQHPNYTIFTANILRQTGGGSCSIIVGPGMEFDNLFEAIPKLLKQGLEDISICMLPGDHNYDKGLNLPKSLVDNLADKDLHLKIRGSGPGTRLNCNLGDQIIEFNVFNSVILEDLEFSINARQNPFSIVNSDIIEFRSCIVTGLIEQGTLIGLDARERIDIQGSNFKCTIASGMKFPSLVLKEVSSGLFTIFDKYDGTNERKFVRSIEKEGRTLAGLSLTERKRTAKKMKDAVDAMGDKLGPAEKEGFDAINEMMVASRVDMAGLIASIRDIKDIAGRSKPGETLAILSQAAVTRIINNRISGTLCLLGLRSDASIIFESSEMGQVQKIIREGMAQFTNVKGSLLIKDNDISRIVLAQYLVENLKSIASTNNRKIDRIFQLLQLSGNRIVNADNQLIAETLVLANNNFRSALAQTGYAVGLSAVFTGNIGMGDSQFFNLTTNFEKSANVMLKIVP